MLFWVLAVLIICFVAAVILYALTADNRAEISLPKENDDSVELLIYKNQLKELSRELKRGAIDQASADEAKLELSRRILNLPQPAIGGCYHRSSATKKIIALAVLFIPVVTFGLYNWLGSPGFSSTPFSMLMRADPQSLTPDQNLVRLGASFMRNPNDGKLADQLATAYLESGRYQNAVNSYADALRLNGENAPRLVGYGIALSQFEGGTITADAQHAFEKAEKLAPQDVYPRIFVAAAIAQSGDTKKAADYLQQFLDQAPKDAAWRKRVEQLIANYKHQSSLTVLEQQELLDRIESLGSQLKVHPQDVDLWQELVQAYIKLGNKDQAQQIFNAGLQILTNEKAQAFTLFGSKLKLTVDSYQKEENE